MAKKKKSLLYRLRVALASIVFPLITLLFLDFTGIVHQYFGFLAKIQFLPALLALNVVVVLTLVVLTIIFGRIYCSVICPLGILQDIFSHLHGRLKRNRFTFSPAKNWLRYGSLIIFMALLLAGFASLAALIDPYSAFGRIAQSLFQPAFLFGNNLLAGLAERMNSYAFYHVDIWIRGIFTLGIAIGTLTIVGILSWKHGRTWCNTICPVGTVLSFLSRFAWFRIFIDAKKCVDCSLCERNCKTEAIDYKVHTVDHSRCVVCGVCQGVCGKQAISYVHKNPNRQFTTEDNNKTAPDNNRRAFLIGAALAAGTAALAQEKKKVDGGLAVIEDKKAPQRQTPITPPGSYSANNMAQHCTACQLCVAACPNHVLRPSTNLKTFMQPVLSYERGFCRPECNRCTQVCPTGAIRPLSVPDKTGAHIGHAVWVRQNCLPAKDGIACGNCERHCPVGAIQMVPLKPDDEFSPLVPAVDEEFCIGCGACEYVCPSRPFPAIYVEGHEQHRMD